jgi:uncharacterized protein YbcV (DUF1398 family)
MNSTSQALIREAADGATEGRLHFGQVIGLLVEAGVESYAVDYRTRRTTYYLPSGKTVGIDLQMQEVGIAEAFDTNAIRAAIRGAQQGVVKYPEFKRLSCEAGCIGYTVWIAGRHVTYFGRRGEVHIERFPD